MSRAKPLRQAAPSVVRIIRRFWPQIRKQRVIIAGSMVALLAETALRLLEPWPLKFIFDRVIVTDASKGESGIGLIDNMDATTLLLVSAVAVVIFTSARAVADYLKRIGFALAGNRILSEVRGNVFRHLQRLSLSYHTKARSGDLITRVTNDIGKLQEVTVRAVLPLIGNIVILAGMFGVMLWINWELGLIAMAALPIASLLMVRFTGRIRQVSRKQRERQSEMAATTAESLAAIKVVQAFSLEGRIERSFSRQNKKSLKEGVQAKRLIAGLARTVDIVLAICTALILWYGARLVLDGSLTPGDLIVFISYVRTGFRPMRDITKYTARIAKAAASGERILEVLDAKREIRDLPDAQPAPAFRGAVRFEGLDFAYEPDKPILTDLNFDIRPGQHVALVGPSGSGKSTLVSLLMRLYDPVQGRVMIDGRDIREYTLESLRSQISIVLQESVLFAVSVRDNISYGAPDATAEEIETAARLANAHEFIEQLPKGYDTIVAEHGASLSGGERQRIAIARAAVRRAPIVILDEPTASLDEENEQAVTQALKRLTQGCTTFLIVHDMQEAERADLILYLGGTRAVEHGTHEELIQLRGRYAVAYALQNGATSDGVQGEAPPTPAFLDKLGDLRRYAQKLTWRERP